MNYENYFKDIFESIPDYKKIVLLIFIFQEVRKLLLEIGFSENDIDCINLEFRKILIKQHEESLDYIENEEESVIESFLNKKTEQYLAMVFEDVKHERSLILLLSLN